MDNRRGGWLGPSQGPSRGRYGPFGETNGAEETGRVGGVVPQQKFFLYIYGKTLFKIYVWYH